jgi:peptidoglycan/LPS O-acetylase OafA/YrhL
MTRKIEPISFRTRREEQEIPFHLRKFGMNGAGTKGREYSWGYFIIGFLLLAAILVLCLLHYLIQLRYGSDPTLSWCKVLSPLIAFFTVSALLAFVYYQKRPYGFVAILGFISLGLVLLLFMLSLTWDGELQTSIVVAIVLPIVLTIVVIVIYSLAHDWSIDQTCFKPKKEDKIDATL